MDTMDNTICPKCGIALHPKAEGDSVIIECSICGFTKEYGNWVMHPCPSCSFPKAIIVLNQNALGDEDWVTILKCLGCGATYKEGFKG